MTSIPPSADGGQGSIVSVATGSFTVNGFTTISVNAPDEIDRIRAAFPAAAIRAATSGVPLFAGRYGPTLCSIFDAAAGYETIGICNSDVVMLTSDVRKRITDDPDIFFAAHRLDVDRLGGNVLGLYRRGIDAVFFDRRRYAALFEDKNLGRFQLGAPLWDIVLPILASFHGSVAFIEPPFILHAVHKTRWLPADYRIARRWAAETVAAHARRYATTRPRASAFVELLERHVGRRDDHLDRRGLRNTMKVFGLWMAKLEHEGRTRLRVEIAGELGDAAVRHLDRPIPDTPSNPELTLVGAAGSPLNMRRIRYKFAAGLRAWKRHRRERAVVSQLADV